MNRSLPARPHARGALTAIVAAALIAACGGGPAANGPHPSPAGAGAGAGAPRTVVLDGAVLVGLRARLRAGDPLLRSAADRLVATARGQPTAGPWSVTEKTQVAPSGDRHDYYSQSIYAWPNPATADGLPWITRDGERNPAADGFGDARAWTQLVDATHALALAPAATGAQPWTAGRQVTTFDPAVALPVLHAAADAGDATARSAIARVPGGGTAADRWLLSPAA